MDTLTYKGRVKINKYRTVNGLAKISEPVPYDSTTLQNRGTRYLWLLLCRFLTSIPTTITIGESETYSGTPQYLEVGYSKEDENVTTYHSALRSSIRCSEAQVLNYASTEEENGAIASFIFSLFSANYQKPKESQQGDSNICLYLCSRPAQVGEEGREIAEESILAVVDTKEKSYIIQEDEVHVFQWELQFTNKAAAQQ